MLVSMFTILLFASCSSLREDYNQINKDVDKEIIPHVKEFQKEFREVVRMPVRFGLNEDRLAGICSIRGDGFREIVINKNLWRKITHEQREELIFHELGHCQFNLRHIEGQYHLTGCPISIMAPATFSDHQATACYKRHRPYYLGQIKVALGK